MRGCLIYGLRGAPESQGRLESGQRVLLQPTRALACLGRALEGPEDSTPRGTLTHWFATGLANALISKVVVKDVLNRLALLKHRSLIYN